MRLQPAIAFIDDARKKGYEIKGPVFKIDYNGVKWNVGFWIRPVDWDNKKKQYRLPALCGKAKHEDLTVAIDMAIKMATPENIVLTY